MLDILFLVGGLVLLFAGAEWLVGHSVLLAKKLGIPVFVIAATIVGFGTSTPELLVSLRAALAGNPDIAVGNIIGSNIANILLIAGIGALITPLFMPRSPATTRDALFLAGSTLALTLMTLTGSITRIEGCIMLALLGFYLFLSLRAGPNSVAVHEVEDLTPSASGPGWKSAILAIIGLVGVLVGADFLVRGAVSIATAMGVSQAVIGLTVVAIGTSLPELAATISAARKGHADVVLGNIVGSNLFNVIGILGVTASVMPLSTAGVATPLTQVFFAITGLYLAWLMYAGSTMARFVGLVCLFAYAAYTIGLLL